MNEYLVLFHSSLQNFFNAAGYVRLASIRETKGTDIDNNGGNRNEMYPLMDTERLQSHRFYSYGIKSRDNRHVEGIGGALY